MLNRLRPLLASCAVVSSLAFGQTPQPPPRFSIEADASRLDQSPFISGDKVFPETAFTSDTPAEWRAQGHVDGNRIGVRPAKDPETGAPVTEFWFEARNLAKRWLSWEKRFPSQLSRESMEGIALEVYPVTPVPSAIMVEFGLPLPIKDIGPAWRGAVGELTPGRWNRLEIRRGSNRHPFPAGMRFLIDISKPGVPEREEIRFLVRNIRSIPSGLPDVSETNPPSNPVEVGAPAVAASLRLGSPAELLWGDASTLELDVAVERPVRAQLHVRLTPEAGGGAIPAEAAPLTVDLSPPVTRVAITHRTPRDASLHSGPALLEVALTDSVSGARILRTGRPFAVHVFNEDDYTRRLDALRASTLELSRRADALAARGILVAEPSVTLEVADLFLSEFIPDDYHRQKERRIAHTLLEQVASLLDKAGRELAARETGAFVERPIPHDYDPTRPIEIRGGRLYQGDAPLLLFGIQETSSFTGIPRLAKLGYNSVLFETHGELFKRNNLLPDAIRRSADNGLAAHLLFSTHYITKLPASSRASHVMMHYDILAPETRPVLHEAYETVLPPLRPLGNLVSVGTANEPGYSIHPSATDYELAFRNWLSAEYGADIRRLNARWRSSHASFADIALADVIRRSNPDPAGSYDWERFRAQTLGEHFRFMKDEILAELPGRMVWVKKYHTFGFGQIDPEVLFDQGSTIHDWSSILNPLMTDYARGIDPSAPLSCSEWKLVPGFTPRTLDADPAPGTLRIFENYARGISWGVIWKWSRRAWRAMGDDYTVTRYPTAMDSIGRTSLRLQQLAPVFNRLASLGDDSVALLYDKVSHLHQGSAYEKDPASGVDSLYWRLNRNSAGVRILHAGRATAADFAPRRLIAAGTANALDAATLRTLRDWVARDGGTLWLAAPGTLALDPWGAPHKDPATADLVAAAATPGERALGAGRVVVDPAWTGYERLLSGPRILDSATAEPVLKDVECRYVPPSPADGKPGYFYILNRTGEPRTVQLVGTAEDTPWAIPADARELWNETAPDLGDNRSSFTLSPWQILLFELPAK